MTECNYIRKLIKDH